MDGFIKRKERVHEQRSEGRRKLEDYKDYRIQKISAYKCPEP